MIACKQQLASTHATQTGTFAGSAHITDPVRFVSILCAPSSFLAVGGDAGDGRCVLGVTYSSPTTQHFAALLVYKGSASWLELQDCRAEGLTPCVGESASFPHVWAALQHFIDPRSAFLHGDWAFINAVLGLMSPSATHPCPICIVSQSSLLLHSSRHRTAADRHSLTIDPSHSPLLTIPTPHSSPPLPRHQPSHHPGCFQRAAGPRSGRAGSQAGYNHCQLMEEFLTPCLFSFPPCLCSALLLSPSLPSLAINARAILLLVMFPPSLRVVCSPWPLLPDSSACSAPKTVQGGSRCRR